MHIITGVIMLACAVSFGQPALGLVPDTLTKNGSAQTVVSFVTRIVNTSATAIPVTLVKRQASALPQDWTASLCFDGACYPPFTDTIRGAEVAANDTAVLELDIFAATGDNQVQVEVALIDNAAQAVAGTITYTASTKIVAITLQADKTRMNKISLYPIRTATPGSQASMVGVISPVSQRVRVVAVDFRGRRVGAWVRDLLGGTPVRLVLPQDRACQGYLWSVEAAD
jgi:hypothetical protein